MLSKCLLAPQRLRCPCGTRHPCNNGSRNTNYGEMMSARRMSVPLSSVARGPQLLQPRLCCLPEPTPAQQLLQARRLRSLLNTSLGRWSRSKLTRGGRCEAAVFARRSRPDSRAEPRAPPSSFQSTSERRSQLDGGESRGAATSGLTRRAAAARLDSKVGVLCPRWCGCSAHRGCAPDLVSECGAARRH